MVTVNEYRLFAGLIIIDSEDRLLELVMEGFNAL